MAVVEFQEKHRSSVKLLPTPPAMHKNQEFINPRVVLAAMAECLDMMVKSLKPSNFCEAPMNAFNVISIIGKKHFKVDVNPMELQQMCSIDDSQLDIMNSRSTNLSHPPQAPQALTSSFTQASVKTVYSSLMILILQKGLKTLIYLDMR